MKLVGIDFAATPRNCGVCVLEDEVITHIGHGIARAKHPEWLVEYCAGAGAVAADVPFGWPKPFIRALAGYEIGIALNRDRRRYLRRSTDAFITQALPELLQREANPPNPLTVAADKLGVNAIVGTVLLNALSGAFVLSHERVAPQRLLWKCTQRLAFRLGACTTGTLKCS